MSAHLTPARGLEFTAAWYRIDYSDRVATPIASLLGVLDNPLYAGLVTLNPSAALLGDIIAGSLLGLETSSNRPYDRSEEHTSELQSLMRISHAVFCLNKKKAKVIERRILQSSKTVSSTL